MSLYLWLNLLSLSVPFLVSFHPRIKLYKYWPKLFAAIFITLIPYIVWDVYFTQSGYWGFNPQYLEGVYFLNLPIEEWLFFICIPYACIFTHYSILLINPDLKLSVKNTNIVFYILCGSLILFAIIFNQKAYTFVNAVFGVVALYIAFKFNKRLLQSFFITFIFMLIPFFIVNGILTGTGISNEVVWYNNQENLGIRLGTIPIEDTIYALSMILFSLLIFEKFSKTTPIRQNSN